MSLFDSLKSLFGANAQNTTHETEVYKDFEITPTPRAEGSQYRICAMIRKDEQEHVFIRADLAGSEEACVKETLRKAKMTIDQLGEGIF